MRGGESGEGADVPKRSQIYKIYLKLGIVVCVVAAGICVIHFTGLKAYLDDAAQIKRTLAQTGWWASCIFTVGAALLILCGAPRLLFCALGGLLFGFLKGFLLAQVATLTSAYVTFLFSRWGVRDWVKNLAKSQQRIPNYFHSPTFLSVFLSRQIPAPGILVNLFWGASSVTQRIFVSGSLVGFFPQALVASLAGSGAAKSSTLHALTQILVAVAILIVGAASMRILMSHFKRLSDNGQTGKGRGNE
jgi:uncharacterized membrane protein YdjX (TVP38/TMEM64 family)